MMSWYLYIKTTLSSVSLSMTVTKCERRFSMSSDHLNKLNGSRKERSKMNVRSTTLSTRKRKRQDSETETATSPVPNRQCQSPSCHITLSSYSIKKGIVYLPKSFVVSNGLRRTCCNTRVIDGKGRSWQVKLNYWNSNGQAYIIKGWKQFQAANNLKPKNVISFRVFEAGKCPVLKCLTT